MSNDKHIGMRGTVDRATDMMGGMMGRAEAATAGGSGETFAERGDEPRLKRFAAETLPILRRHGDAVRALRAS